MAQQGTETRYQFNELMAGSPVNEPIVQLQHDLPPRGADLSNNLTQVKGQVVGLPRKYRWRRNVYLFFLLLGLLLAAKVVMDAFSDGTITLRGIYGIGFGLAGYVFLLSVAIKRHKACGSGICEFDKTVTSVCGQQVVRISIREIAELSVKTLSSHRQMDQVALRESPENPVGFQQRELQAYCEGIYDATSKDVRHQRRAMRSEHQLFMAGKVYYLQARTHQGTLVWIAQSKELEELLVFAGYLRDLSKADDSVRHETFMDQSLSEIDVDEWRFVRSDNAFSTMFLLGTIMIAGAWLLGNTQLWVWPYLPYTSPSLSNVIHVTLLAPLVISLAAHFVQPAFWQLDRGVHRKESPEGPEELIIPACILGATAMILTVYLGLRFVDYVESRVFSTMVGMVILLLIWEAKGNRGKRTIHKAEDAKGSSSSGTLASQLDRINQLYSALGFQRSWAHRVWSVPRMALWGGLLLGGVSLLSVISNFLMNAPMAGGGGKVSFPIYIDLMVLYFILSGSYWLLRSRTNQWLALALSAIVTLPAIYVAIVLTAIPSLISLPLLALIFLLSANLLIVSAV